jgi:hypothetical protein
LEQKWPKLGSATDVRVCYDYLKGKPKWNAFVESQVTTNDKHNRPNRKKNEIKMIKDKSLIKEVVQQLDSSPNSGSANANTDGKDYFYAQAGLALAFYYTSHKNQQKSIFKYDDITRKERNNCNEKECDVVQDAR